MIKSESDFKKCVNTLIYNRELAMVRVRSDLD
jgi:hypothetical protein